MPFVGIPFGPFQRYSREWASSGLSIGFSAASFLRHLNALTYTKNPTSNHDCHHKVILIFKLQQFSIVAWLPGGVAP